MDVNSKRFKTAKEMWQSYSLEVIPADAPKIQRDECRFAFYAGLYQMMCVNVECGEERTSEEDGIKWMDSLYDEITETVSAMIMQRMEETGGVN